MSAVGIDHSLPAGQEPCLEKEGQAPVFPLRRKVKAMVNAGSFMLGKMSYPLSPGLWDTSPCITSTENTLKG